MSSNNLCFVISHGNLACSLKKVAEQLAVPQTNLLCYSNQILALEEIEKQICSKIDSARTEKILIFTDLVGGSCWLLANRIKQSYQSTRIIGGVNVPMIVSFFVNYNNLSWDQLTRKITEDGRKGIVIRF